MRSFVKSIFFYPTVTLIVIMFGMFASYEYITYNATKTIISQGIREAKEDSYLLKNTIEDLSIIKKHENIQRKVMLTATKQYVRRIMLVSKDNVMVIYSHINSNYHHILSILPQRYKKTALYRLYYITHK